jgi:hypothetical protein
VRQKRVRVGAEDLERVFTLAEWYGGARSQEDDEALTRIRDLLGLPDS